MYSAIDNKVWLIYENQVDAWRAAIGNIGRFIYWLLEPLNSFKLTFFSCWNVIIPPFYISWHYNHWVIVSGKNCNWKYPEVKIQDSSEFWVPITQFFDPIVTSQRRLSWIRYHIKYYSFLVIIQILSPLYIVWIICRKQTIPI